MYTKSFLSARERRNVLGIIYTYIVILVMFAVGWVLNIAWLLSFDGDVTPRFFMALVGILVAPFGAIHGWFSVFF